MLKLKVTGDTEPIFGPDLPHEYNFFQGLYVIFNSYGWRYYSVKVIACLLLGQTWTEYDLGGDIHLKLIRK